MIIDTHFHAFPGKFLELMPDAQNDVRGVGFHAFDHREYLNVMDQYGIDIGVLSNTGGRIEKAGDRAKALELCKILNDSFADAHAKHPHRFKAFARLPMVDTDDCVRELHRCYEELGMHGVMMPTNLAGKYLDEAEFKPFWDALAAGDKPLFSSSGQCPVPGQLEQVLAASKNTLAHRQHFGPFAYRLLRRFRSLPGLEADCLPSRWYDPTVSRPAQLARR
jgi:predicted TIM-barrel fold metal-dependent hydrolase